MTIDEACNMSLPCDNEMATVPDSSTEYGQTNHNINIRQVATIMGIEYELMSFQRIFNISGHDSGSEGISAVVRTVDGEYPCPGTSTRSVTGSVSENCTQILIIPMYLNLTDGIFVYEKRIETIQFNANAHEKKANFKTKWGFKGYWKYVIKKTGDKEYLQTTQEFHIVKDGVDTILHTAYKDSNPFQDAAPLASWGLYGNAQYSLNDETPDSTVRQILVYPIVPSLAIPWDKCGANCAPSVNNYGFYDYNAVEGGMIMSDLGAQDGGKDFYYPYWLRQMTENPVMREWADLRWMKNWLHEEVSDGDWTPPTPTTYNWPFGSFVRDSQGNYIHSAIFTDLNGESFLYNSCNPLDIFEKITTVSGVENTLYCPITLISNIYGLSDGVGQTEDQDEFTDDLGETITDDSGVDIYA